MPGFSSATLYRPWKSNAPAAIGALVAIVEQHVAFFNTYNTGPDVLVKDGMWTSKESGQQVIVVGWSGFVPGYEYPSRSMSEELASPALTATETMEGLGPSILEQFDINCASIVRIGDTSMSEARSAAYQNTALVGDVITPPWLGGNVMRATMGAVVQLHQVQDRRGALAVVTFSILCEAYAQQ